jgi:hypothetical protein
MKKLLLIGLAAFLLPACTVNTNEPATYLTAETFYITVYPKLAPAGDWNIPQSVDDNYIYAEKSLSAITRGVIENGVVMAYYLDGDYDNLLPYIRSYTIGSFEVIRYDIQAGKITFIIENNETNVPRIPDNYQMEFKVVVLRNY